MDHSNIVACDVDEPIDGVQYPLATTEDMAATVESVERLGARSSPAPVTSDPRSRSTPSSVVSFLDEAGWSWWSAD